MGYVKNHSFILQSSCKPSLQRDAIVHSYHNSVGGNVVCAVLRGRVSSDE